MGRVPSDRSQLVVYGGKPLQPGAVYYWRVKVWDKTGQETFSSIASFRMAPAIADLKARWIGAISRSEAHLPSGRTWHVPSFKKEAVNQTWQAISPLGLRSIWLRKTFQVNQPLSSAILHVSGLGHYEARLNGNLY